MGEMEEEKRKKKREEGGDLCGQREEENGDNGSSDMALNREKERNLGKDGKMPRPARE